LSKFVFQRKSQRGNSGKKKERKIKEEEKNSKTLEADQEVLGPRALIVVSSSYQSLPRG